ncbi:MAG: oligosaccharide flippase family protein [Rhodospirillales bacterium]|nr:oligosaccharide flippase family protein [Rhodospirillales bacterium]
MIASMVVIMVAVRVYEKEDVGAYFLVLMVANMAHTVCRMGLGNTAIRYLASEKGSAYVDTARFLVTANTVLACVAVLLLLVLQPLMLWIWPSEAFQALWFYCLPIAWLRMLFLMGQSMLAAERRFVALTMCTGGSEILRLALTIALIALGEPVESLFIGTVVAYFIFDLGMAYLLRRYLRPRLSHQRWAEMLRFGGMLQGSSVINLIANRFVEGLLASYLGTAALATYSTAMQVPRQMVRAFDSQRPVLLGLVSSLKVSEEEARLHLFRFTGGLLTITAAVLIAGAKPLVVLFYTEKYLESVPIMQILVFWITVNLLNEMMGILLMGLGRARSLFQLSILRLVVMTGFGYWLISTYQGVGGAIALLLTSLVVAFFSSLLMTTENRALHRRYVGAYLKVMVLLAASTAVVLLLGPPLPGAALGIVIIVGLTFLLRLLTVSDLNLLVRRLRAA